MRHFLLKYLHRVELLSVGARVSRNLSEIFRLTQILDFKFILNIRDCFHLITLQSSFKSLEMPGSKIMQDNVEIKDISLRSNHQSFIHLTKKRSLRTERVCK